MTLALRVTPVGGFDPSMGLRAVVSVRQIIGPVIPRRHREEQYGQRNATENRYGLG